MAKPVKEISLLICINRSILSILLKKYPQDNEQLFVLNATWLRKHPTYSIYYVLVSRIGIITIILIIVTITIVSVIDIIISVPLFSLQLCFFLDWKFPCNEPGPNGPYHSPQFSHLQEGPQVRDLLWCNWRNNTDRDNLVILWVAAATSVEGSKSYKELLKK